MPIFRPHSKLFMNKSNFFSSLAWWCISNASFQESVQPTGMNDDKENDSRICGIKETQKAYGLAFFYSYLLPVKLQDCKNMMPVFMWSCKQCRTTICLLVTKIFEFLPKNAVGDNYRA